MNTVAPGRKRWMDDEDDFESSGMDEVSPDELDKFLDEYDETGEIELIPDERG